MAKNERWGELPATTAAQGLARSVIRLSIYVASVFMVAACGGSASETPPPLEPDPHAVPTARTAAKREGVDAVPELPEQQYGAVAPPTWGSGRTRAPVVDSLDGG